MSFDTMLNHKCDVYHIKREDKSPGYGLPSSPSFSYSGTPDIVDLACHFNTKNGGVSALLVTQSEPMANLEGKIKLVLPLGTDIRLNDKIVNKQNGYEYTAEVPVQVRNHHLYVMVKRTTAQEPL